MATLDAAMTTLQQVGFFRIVLPFVFTFAVIYGVISKIDLFGDYSDEVGGIIGVAAGLFVARFVVVSGLNVAGVVSNYMGAMAVVFLFLMAAVLVRGMAPGLDDDDAATYHKLFMFLGIIAAVLLFFAWGGLGIIFPNGPTSASVFVSSTTFVTLLVVLLALAAIAWVTGWFSDGGDDDGGDDGQQGGPGTSA